MAKIYEKAKDVHVRATYVYKKSGDAYAYVDAAKTTKIDAEDLQELFRKGCLIIDSDVEYKPVSYDITSEVGTITYVKTDTNTATTAVLATLKSSEYSAE